MSPITQQARERLMEYLAKIPSVDAPPQEPPLLKRLIDDLVAAVRGEHPEDTPF